LAHLQNQKNTELVELIDRWNGHLRVDGSTNIVGVPNALKKNDRVVLDLLVRNLAEEVMHAV
jgi:hypothetical protein